MALRARVLRAIRAFFDDLSFLDVETPVRLPQPALELHIEAEPAGNAFLRTSPELHMKRLLASGLPRIYQLGPCFRRGERGALHHPEFTMLEWYRGHAGSSDILEDALALLPHVAQAAIGTTSLPPPVNPPLDLAAPPAVFTVREAFLSFAGWDPIARYDEDRFCLDLVEKVEPALPRDRPVILRDYPAPAAALARLLPDDCRAADRWELYLAGIEIANAFGELTDAAQQRRRFAECRLARARDDRPLYPMDEAFLEALQRMPPAGGIALGVDRLVMLLAGTTRINGILPFP